MLKTKLKNWLIFGCIFLSGCVGSLGNISSSNPIERGLSYIAAAIVTHAVIRAIFN